MACQHHLHFLITKFNGGDPVYLCDGCRTIVGRVPLAAQVQEPPQGSVVLLHGDTGTAYQRFFSDGLYHAAGRTEALTFDELRIRAGSQPIYVLAPHTRLMMSV